MPVRRALARAMFRVSGWRKVGTLPRTGIFVGAPHTSNWDFVLTLMVLWADDVPPRVLVKREAFRGPLAWFFASLGAIPTDRRGGAGLVRSLIHEAGASEGFVLVLAAEGTRARTDHWKSGFYRIALETGLPLTLGFIDGPTRTTGSGDTFVVTGDVRADMDRIRAFYADKRGVRPERVSTPRLREEDVLDGEPLTDPSGPPQDPQDDTPPR
ncbi:1-acyl-sn-glycerol-3-phosphate acyltransferase [Actinotalea sp. K2]|uniref:1-acyl-sn-glycerol-3-phosphate acyltransferase n=1 Tax=Actinotalea sp. K2 TaxID=2939438 RepID=UPI002017DFE5|nr:1-acyl-sn-glycerol-3-phosphate acyltransferase [Actinotalea sp. K2]MCL3861351.1 1-acyl-sn-glycerol-3-phosphate acyltransferase [Actinotalea sp. K2]